MSVLFPASTCPATVSMAHVVYSWDIHTNNDETGIPLARDALKLFNNVDPFALRWGSIADVELRHSRCSLVGRGTSLAFVSFLGCCSGWSLFAR